MKHLYDATINGVKIKLFARDMRFAHRALMREVKKRITDPKTKTTVTIQRRGSDYPPHEETV